MVHDALIHASAHDGMRAGRAELAEAAHNDADAFEDKILAWRAAGGNGRPWIAVESLYSMDGDRAPLSDLAAIAARHDGILVIDEAHATGVYGPDGRGLGAWLEGSTDGIGGVAGGGVMNEGTPPHPVPLPLGEGTVLQSLRIVNEAVRQPQRSLFQGRRDRVRGESFDYDTRPPVISLHTCGKALGSAGALLCGPRIFRDFLINYSRPFIFSTAPSPLTAAAVRAALRLCKEQPERRERLLALNGTANAAIENRCGVSPSGSQILPVIVGADTRATTLAAAMRAHGYDIRAIRPPTVPEGTARLRIALTLNTSAEVVLEMIEVLRLELERLGA